MLRSHGRSHAAATAATATLFDTRVPPIFPALAQFPCPVRRRFGQAAGLPFPECQPAAKAPLLLLRASETGERPGFGAAAVPRRRRRRLLLRQGLRRSRRCQGRRGPVRPWRGAQIVRRWPPQLFCLAPHHPTPPHATNSFRTQNPPAHLARQPITPLKPRQPPPQSFASRYAECDFCLHPPGDTRARRGIFDSLLAGCVPVLFDSSLCASESEAELNSLESPILPNATAA